MKKLAACFLAALISLPALASPQEASTADDELLVIGRRIYREGVLPSGEPLRGLGEANVTLTGVEAACATCHRRSGYGSSEGPIEVRAITGPALFGDRVAPIAPGSPAVPVAVADELGLTAAEVARNRARLLRDARAAQFFGTRQRPAYDDASLVHALQEGIDVTGSRMKASMPRYALDPASQVALTAYLRTLSAQVSPGVTDDRVHFATVIQPGSDPAQRRAMLDVFQTFIQDRNLGLRAQAQREQGGVKRLGRKYRDWVLHVWDLTGSSDTWPRQLEAYYQAQPVFALLGGLGNANWRPIHEFSERFEVPCILPQTELPVLAKGDFYTVYLSRGVTLEAQALVKYLLNAGERGPVLQVFRQGEANVVGAGAFSEAWTAATGAAPMDIPLEEDPDEAFWQRLSQQANGATLVLWLSNPDLELAQALTAAGSRVKAIYIFSSLLTTPRKGLTADATGQVRLVYPQDPPMLRDARVAVVKRWLRNNGIAPGDEKVQMNAYLAATVTGMLVTHGKDTYSREFLLERMEHRLGTALEPSIYPHLSLGPGQRFASKGSYIVAVGGANDQDLTPVSEWIVP